MTQQTPRERVTEQFRRAADDAAQITRDQQSSTDPPPGSAAQLLPPPAPGMSLADVLYEFGDRWDLARITGGYRAVIRDAGGTPIPRYGRTPAEVAESIRLLERTP